MIDTLYVNTKLVYCLFKRMRESHTRNTHTHTQKRRTFTSLLPRTLRAYVSIRQHTSAYVSTCCVRVGLGGEETLVVRLQLRREQARDAAATRNTRTFANKVRVSSKLVN